MPSKRESSDAAWQGRTYRSTASAKQVRFPARRSRVRGQGNGVQKRERASLKQQTLTQMAFVSSFSDEAPFMDDDDDDNDDDDDDDEEEDDASARTACDDNKPAPPQRSSEADLRKQPRDPIRRSTRGSGRGTSPVIRDSYGTQDGSFPDDVLVEASPPQLRPSQGRDAAVSPRRRGRRGPSDVVRASPRRRAHWSRYSRGPRSPEESSQAEDTPPSGDYADDREIPDSDEEDEDLELQDDGPVVQQDTFATGYETQLVLEELASLDSPQLDGQEAANDQLPTSISQSSALASSAGTAISKPALPPIEATEGLPTPAETASQLPSTPPFAKAACPSPAQAEPNRSQVWPDQAFESQRVPLHVLQSFTPVSARTDILLPTPPSVLMSIVDGSETTLRLTYRVPEEVRRFWLFDHDILRYMACVQPGTPRGFLDWEYSVDQVYELNNPIEEHDMQEEGWVTGQVRRYIYLPPAIVGQLLWNLRCATLTHGASQPGEDDGPEDGVRQSSSNNADTQDSHAPKFLDSKHGARIPAAISSQPAIYCEHRTSPRATDPPSSLTFEDYGSSTTTITLNDVAALGSSPLLTKSQMLPDSLISDDLP
ncbi:uncharacterized protein TRIREDRAFT_104617 [Trichoderma reesei QM6a]|uniref:Uncharacterized protein n=1 Tax=Hypocrea jecorina (strain QM6a) TaxID=431241 RepID=G0RBD6_HYPJQ|nr:uncharacterized protein TRIREDRAFT_104617 [Trichoderma reesei QM6a]EGR51294.1 hypothetical protein TRIREDRAFT_104617 [Trichoderma reesei QM6a]